MTDDAAQAGATARLAAFVHAARFADLPPSARHAALRAIVNIVGCCVGGAEHEIVQASVRALLPLGGAPVASVLGRGERSDILTATCLNALSSAAYSFDDTHAQSIIHPSGAVASALLALAERQRITGEDFLLAFVLGVDVACRLSKAVSVAPAEGDIAWSQTGIAAGVGAAAAAARVLGLDAQRTGWAIGIAALQASGFREAHGTMSATLLFGNAAQSGLRAALLAREGLTAPAAPLEGKYGYAHLYSTRTHLPYLTEALGEAFEVEALAYKPYPCGVVIHPMVDAALAWHRARAPGAARIQKVMINAHPSALALGFRRHPAGVLEAKVSLYHWVAAALAHGRASLAEGRQAVIDEPEVVRLRDCIELLGDDTLETDATAMTVVLEGGAQQVFKVGHCKGSVANPMTDEDLSGKFLGQADTALPADAAHALLAACWKLHELRDAADVARLAGRAG
ncbi:MmgE/PrpD family protein [Polaromonas sp. P1(28)-13]|nr:MmgE/PrpD family protein [Polaromonas sp. P1(28)-13]